MTNSNRHDEPRTGATGDDAAPEVDVLIGRIIDGEAQREDVERFADLVARDRSAAHLLAERQRDQALVSAAVVADLDRAARINLPAKRSPTSRAAVIAIVRHAPAYLGWAAAIVLALILGFADFSPPPANVNLIDREKIQPHIIEQRAVPGALDPVLLYSEQLPDGRWKIGIMERPIRIFYLDHFEEAFLRQERADRVAQPERDDM